MLFGSNSIGNLGTTGLDVAPMRGHNENSRSAGSRDNSIVKAFLLILSKLGVAGVSVCVMHGNFGRGMVRAKHPPFMD